MLVLEDHFNLIKKSDNSYELEYYNDSDADEYEYY